MIQYRVVPFAASVGSQEGGGQAAAQLEEMIRAHAEDGWDYVRLEQVDTHVAGDPGCFGIGATPGFQTSCPMAVFKKCD